MGLGTLAGKLRQVLSQVGRGVKRTGGAAHTMPSRLSVLAAHSQRKAQGIIRRGVLRATPKVKRLAGGSGHSLRGIQQKRYAMRKSF